MWLVGLCRTDSSYPLSPMGERDKRTNPLFSCSFPRNFFAISTSGRALRPESRHQVRQKHPGVMPPDRCRAGIFFISLSLFHNSNKDALLGFALLILFFAFPVPSEGKDEKNGF